jgi:peptidoglycan/LPS O-acetylase OafA/YrhL
MATSPGMLPTIVGLVAHVSWMMIWGIIFVALSRRTKPATTVLLAFVVGVGVAVIARFVLPAAFGAVQFAVMPGVQAALCVVLLAAGLVAGRAMSRADSTSPRNLA